MSFKYYSFVVSAPRTPVSHWRMLDIKVPAFNPKEALITHQFIKANCHKNFIIPNTYFIQSIYRQVIEFEKVRQKGVTNVTYKKIKVYSERDIAKWFKNNE